MDKPERSVLIEKVADAAWWIIFHSSYYADGKFMIDEKSLLNLKSSLTELEIHDGLETLS